jgi:hypothetical protein
VLIFLRAIAAPLAALTVLIMLVVLDALFTDLINGQPMSRA